MVAKMHYSRVNQIKLLISLVCKIDNLFCALSLVQFPTLKVQSHLNYAINLARLLPSYFVIKYSRLALHKIANILTTNSKAIGA